MKKIFSNRKFTIQDMKSFGNKNVPVLLSQRYMYSMKVVANIPSSEQDYIVVDCDDSEREYVPKVHAAVECGVSIPQLRCNTLEDALRLVEILNQPYILRVKGEHAEDVAHYLKSKLGNVVVEFIPFGW